MEQVDAKKSDNLEGVTIQALTAAIPAHCFERDVWRSLGSLFFSLLWVVLAGLFAWWWLPPLTLSPLSWVGWAFYALVNGTLATGLWVIAHECGHGAFCEHKGLQHTVGYVLHTLLLVPYFSWQRSHALHHAFTNHLTRGETHVPDLAETSAGKRQIALHRWLGEDAFAVVNLLKHLLLGWPAYLLAGTTGSPERGPSNHFVPTNTALFPGARKRKVWLSTLGILAVLVGLFVWSWSVGFSVVLGLYVGPYLVVNAWLVLYTWLQHTDIEVPHYDATTWNWLRGALTTIDRPYPRLIDVLHHHIGTTHVVHHLFSQLPHYHAVEATNALRAAYPALMRVDQTPLPKALWRIAKYCIVVEQVRPGEWEYTPDSSALARRP